jgi:hypothetical protein
VWWTRRRPSNDEAISESVLSDFIAVSKYAGLEARMTEIEERLNARAGNTN